MRNSVIAIVLCFFAAAASAQCVAQAPAAGTEQPEAGMIKTAATPSQAQQKLPMDDGPPVLTEAAPPATSSEQEPRRAGPAMVLAAVAAMSAIALRRYGSRMQ